MAAPRSRLIVASSMAVLTFAFVFNPAQASTGLEGVPAFGHVFLIIGENTELSQLKTVNAPYLLNTVMPTSAWLTNYFALTHYSEANYVGMTSGQFTSCQQKDGSAASCHQDMPSLFSQLDGAGVPWQSWMESAPAPCYLSSAGGDRTLNHYAPKHNPAIFFDGIEGAGGVWSSTNQSAECLANDIPAGTIGPNDMSAFNGALSNNTVSRFNLIVPNECEDAHDNCKPAGNPITQYDNFLANEVPLIQTWGQSFGGNDWAIIITFDEGITNGPNHADKFGNGGNIAFAVLGPLVHPATYATTVSDHYGLLRTLEDGFGITTYLGNASLASPINTIWNS